MLWQNYAICQDSIQQEKNGKPFAQVVHQHSARRRPISEEDLKHRQNLGVSCVSFPESLGDGDWSSCWLPMERYSWESGKFRVNCTFFLSITIIKNKRRLWLKKMWAPSRLFFENQPWLQHVNLVFLPWLFPPEKVAAIPWPNQADSAPKWRCEWTCRSTCKLPGKHLCEPEIHQG